MHVRPTRLICLKPSCAHSEKGMIDQAAPLLVYKAQDQCLRHMSTSCVNVNGTEGDKKGVFRIG